MAPFWADVNIDTGVGQISYEVHSTASSTAIAQVNTFINDTDFAGQWMLIAEWSGVPQFGESTLVVRKYDWQPL